mgnify:CR=1 FL=1
MSSAVPCARSDTARSTASRCAVTWRPAWRNERAGLKDAMLVKGVKLTISGHKHTDPTKKVFKAERLVIDGKAFDLYPDRN